MIITRVQTECENGAVVILFGASARHADELSQWGSAEGVQMQTAISLAEMALFDLKHVCVILAWDEGDTIELLVRQLAATDSRLTVLAISDGATVRKVVRAMTCGAADYIDWPDEAHLLLPAIKAVHEAGQRARAPSTRTRAGAALSKLSRRERQVLSLMAEGMTNKIIARSLKISPRTVEIHRANMLEKLKSKSSADAIRLFFEATMPVQLQAEYAAGRALPGDAQRVNESKVGEHPPELVSQAHR